MKNNNRKPFEDHFPFMRARRKKVDLVYTYQTQQWKKRHKGLPDDFFDFPGAAARLLLRKEE